MKFVVLCLDLDWGYKSPIAYQRLQVRGYKLGISNHELHIWEKSEIYISDVANQLQNRGYKTEVTKQKLQNGGYKTEVTNKRFTNTCMRLWTWGYK